MLKARHTSSHARLQLLLFVCVMLVWLAFDAITKQLATTNLSLSSSIAFVPGVVDFQLAHNFGAAWSMFSGSSIALGVFSLIVCALIVGYVILTRFTISTCATIGLGLIVAGGIGNAYDRFVYGYVIDFLQTTFIQFPIFNVADIGVTCGIVIFLVSYVVSNSTRLRLEQT